MEKALANPQLAIKLMRASPVLLMPFLTYLFSESFKSEIQYEESTLPSSVEAYLSGIQTNDNYSHEAVGF